MCNVASSTGHLGVLLHSCGAGMTHLLNKQSFCWDASRLAGLPPRRDKSVTERWKKKKKKKKLKGFFRVTIRLFSNVVMIYVWENTPALRVLHYHVSKQKRSCTAANLPSLILFCWWISPKTTWKKSLTFVCSPFLYWVSLFVHVCVWESWRPVAAAMQYHRTEWYKCVHRMSPAHKRQKWDYSTKNWHEHIKENGRFKSHGSFL